MKKIFFAIAMLPFIAVSAQFKVKVTNPDITGNAILYTLDGSKNIIQGTENKKNNGWEFKVPNRYEGMMRIFFPDNGEAVNFISENKDVALNLTTKNKKIINVEYLDDSNKLMSSIQEIQQKKDVILPALVQIATYYTKPSDFSVALDNEVKRLSQKNTTDVSTHPFISYYQTNYDKYVAKQPDGSSKTSRAEIANFLTNSNQYLESSSLLRPVLMEYLSLGKNETVPSAIDDLLSKVNVETPRGQNILSELIDIFDAYDMQDLKTKYLSQAQSLKCTINDKLSATIKQNNNVKIGAQIPNFKFVQAKNTTAKSLYDVKANKKVLIFWASTCSHCEAELPQLLEKYSDLKKQNVEVVALSVDADRESYENRVKSFPWINDTELRGWNSSFVETYNIHATPTYFILDSQNKILAKPDHVGDVLSYFNQK